MFSCCRANPKNSKKSKKQSEETTKEQQQQEISQQNDALTKNDNKKLIIPTINIENGKTMIDNITNNERSVQEQNGNKTTAESVNNEEDKLSEIENITQTITTEVIEKIPQETETAKVQTTTTKTTKTTIEAEPNVGTEITSTMERNVDSDNASSANDAEIICCKILQNSNNYLQNDSSEVETIKNDDVTQKCSPESKTQTNDENIVERAESPSTITTTTTATQYTHCDANNSNSTTTTTTNNGKPKSCLSRHNSTHTSIKKRVNISVHTEIIEPDPLLPIQVPITSSVGDEEDDVFSDSVPPPKRESMCAPYLERDIDYDDVVTETLAYAHGLPEWFNDERITDV